MAEKYDAFGRRVDEDTLAEAGWRVSDSARGETHTIQAPEPVTTTPPPGSLPPPDLSTVPTVFDEARAHRRLPRKRGGGKLVVVLLLLAFGGIFFAGFIGGIVEEIEDATDSSGGFSFQIGSDESGGPATEAPQAPGTGAVPNVAQTGSLYEPTRMRAALAALKKEGGSPMMIRVAADRLNTQLVDGGDLKIVEVGPDLKLRQVASAPAPQGVTTILLTSIDPRAPQRLLAGAERTHRLPAAKVSYMVAMEFNGSVMWNAFYEGGAHVQGDKAGKLTRRVS